MTRFTGIITPIITPLTDSGEIDRASLVAVVERQLAAGVDGLFALGSSGEAAYLSDSDRRIVADIVVRTVAGTVPVLVGAVDTATRRVIDQVASIAHAGVDATVVTAPFYANVAANETLTHFRRVAAATSLPVFAYDIPGNVGRKLDASTSIRLLQEGTIAGLKDSSGDAAQFARVLTALGPDRSSSILTGADAGALVALEAGADGIVPGVGNIEPEWFVALRAAFLAKDLTAAAEIQARIARLNAVFGIGERHGVGRHASELGALKVSLQEAGVITSATLSPPLSPYPDTARRELVALLTEAAV